MAMERQPESRSDAEIDLDVRETLLWDVRVDDSTLDVSVVDGVVHLTGKAGTLSEKRAAGEDAARIKGVREVRNDITVSPPTLRRDEDVARDVESALRRDRRLHARHINVHVKDGIVRLTGTVHTLAQKKAALEDVLHTAGVVDFVDELRVVALRRRSDPEIVADVRTVLAASGIVLDPPRIDVSARDGTVYLRGGVENEVERHAAEEAAGLISGVKDVVNELVVAPIANLPQP